MIWAGRFRAVLMLLLILAAFSFVSAGAAHHREAAPAVQYTQDDHQHGTEWTPTTGSSRLRPVADVPVRAVTSADTRAPAPIDLVEPAGGAGRGDEASHLVLRV
jgi:hypothetical protein